MEMGWPDLQQRRGERGLEKVGEKRNEKREERERNRKKKKKNLKKWSIKRFFLFNEEL
jgi:hypothetical protein